MNDPVSRPQTPLITPPGAIVGASQQQPGQQTGTNFPLPPAQMPQPVTIPGGTIPLTPYRFTALLDTRNSPADGSAPLQWIPYTPGGFPSFNPDPSNSFSSPSTWIPPVGGMYLVTVSLDSGAATDFYLFGYLTFPEGEFISWATSSQGYSGYGCSLGISQIALALPTGQDFSVTVGAFNLGTGPGSGDHGVTPTSFNWAESFLSIIYLGGPVI